MYYRIRDWIWSNIAFPIVTTPDPEFEDAGITKDKRYARIITRLFDRIP